MPTDEQRRLIVGVLVATSGVLLTPVLPELDGQTRVTLGVVALAVSLWVALDLPGYRPRPHIHLPPGVQRPRRVLTLWDQLTLLAILVLVTLVVLSITHEVQPYSGGYGVQVALALVYFLGVLGALVGVLVVAALRVWRWLRRKP